MTVLKLGPVPCKRKGHTGLPSSGHANCFAQFAVSGTWISWRVSEEVGFLKHSKCNSSQFSAMLEDPWSWECLDSEKWLDVLPGLWHPLQVAQKLGETEMTKKEIKDCRLRGKSNWGWLVLLDDGANHGTNLRAKEYAGYINDILWKKIGK